MSLVSILYQFQYYEYACLIPIKNQSLTEYEDKVGVKVFKRLSQGCFLMKPCQSKKKNQSAQKGGNTRNKMEGPMSNK
jgi:hypothetical protein